MGTAIGKQLRKDYPSPARRLRYLESEEAIALVSATLRHAMRKSLRDEERRLKRDCPSSTWVNAAWEGGEQLPSGWIRCAVCRRLVPPQVVGSQGACYECQLDATPWPVLCKLPSSPSGLAIRFAEDAGITIKGF